MALKGEPAVVSQVQTSARGLWTERAADLEGSSLLSHSACSLCLA